MIGVTETLHAEAATADESVTSTRQRLMEDNCNYNNNCNRGGGEREESLKPPATLIPIAEDFLLMDEDKDVIVDAEVATTNRVSFMRRLTRPNNLKLAPSHSRSVTPSENSMDDTETGSDQMDGKRRKSRISKPLDIGFRNLSYSVKTGIFRRGE